MRLAVVDGSCRRTERLRDYGCSLSVRQIRSGTLSGSTVVGGGGEPSSADGTSPRYPESAAIGGTADASMSRGGNTSGVWVSGGRVGGRPRRCGDSTPRPGPSIRSATAGPGLSRLRGPVFATRRGNEHQVWRKRVEDSLLTVCLPSVWPRACRRISRASPGTAATRSYAGGGSPRGDGSSLRR